MQNQYHTHARPFAPQDPSWLSSKGCLSANTTPPSGTSPTWTVTAYLICRAALCSVKTPPTPFLTKRIASSVSQSRTPIASSTLAAAMTPPFSPTMPKCSREIRPTISTPIDKIESDAFINLFILFAYLSPSHLFIPQHCTIPGICFVRYDVALSYFGHRKG